MQKHKIQTETRTTSELLLMKELTILRRARSLRDPSTSPRSNSSYGSIRQQGRKKGDEARVKKGVGSNSRIDTRKVDSKREKLHLRPGGLHWVGEFLGEEAEYLQVTRCAGSDPKEGYVLESNGLKDGYQGVMEELKTKSTIGTGKKGRKWDKVRSYPRVGHANGDEMSRDSQRRPKRPVVERHLEMGDMGDGSILGERILSVNEKRQLGSVRVVKNSWVEEPQRRAEIARRVISETSNFDGLKGHDLDIRLPSPTFSPSASVASAHRGPDHMDLLSVVNALKDEVDRDDSRVRGDGGGEKEEEIDDFSPTNGLTQAPLSLGYHTHSPLMYRDSIRLDVNQHSIPRDRRKSASLSGSGDGDKRHREGITVRVVGKARGRPRGRRAGMRPMLSFSSYGRPISGMEGELDVSELPRNGCGIPWYRTRMDKYRGKRFLDIAGKSLACGFTEGPKRKEDSNLDLKHGSPNSHTMLVQCNRHTPSLGDHYGLSSYCEYPSHRLEFYEGTSSPEIPRADGSLLTADYSDELLFVSTKEELNRGLVATSSPMGHESRPSFRVASQEPNRSFSQKYRPISFSELVGQGLVTKSLSTALLKGNIASLYLFQGPRGTGKSSAARIFAQALNCISEDFKIPKPCGFCSECTSSSSDVIELDATTFMGVDGVKAVTRSMFSAPSSSRYRVFIIDDCHCLSGEDWRTILKALEKTPWHIVCILITTEIDKVPRTASSRCQKFLFSKIKEAEIFKRLQSLATIERLEVEEPALALVAARSQGSLREAETLLDQISLLGRTVSLSMVQEMVGMVSDEKLIELLDLAISAKAVSTVRCMRELLDGGMEPLVLVSQLATLITDILAETYVVSREKLNEGFFKQSSREEEAVRLRQALKILSEAEKQLRLSNDQPTWLTAALLQFAPDRSFQPSSHETSVVASRVPAVKDTGKKETGDVHPWTNDLLIQSQPENCKREVVSGKEKHFSSKYRDKCKKKSVPVSYTEAKIYPTDSPVTGQSRNPGDNVSGRPSNAKSDPLPLPLCIDNLNQKDLTVISQLKLEEVWQRVLHGSRSNVLRQLLQGHGKLLSLLLSDAFAVAHLEFRHPEHKARAERSRSRICTTFQMALGCPVELQISLACMSGEQQLGFTKSENQPCIADGWHKEKAKVKIPTPDRSNDRKMPSQSYRRQRVSRVQCHVDSLNIPQSLYSAVLGDSKGFKPEILPVVSSASWGIQVEGKRFNEIPETKTFSFAPLQETRQQCNSQIISAPSVTSLLNVPHKILTHQSDNASARQCLTTDLMCGSGSKRTDKKLGDVTSGRRASLKRKNVRWKSHLNPPQAEPRLLCWRVQNLDEEKIRVQRRKRQRRVRLLLKIVPCTKSHPRSKYQEAHLL